MSYLITQTFLLLLIAGLLGLILGWYLTRISTRSVCESLQMRLRDAEHDVSELRGERDAAVVARDSVETERRLLSDELNALKAQQGSGDDDSSGLREALEQCRNELAAAVDPAEHAALKQELEACRVALEGAVTPAPASDQEVDTAAIAAAAAAAASGVSSLMATTSAAPPTGSDGSAPDDLRQIKGIGPKIADLLDELGIQRFDQIAAWTPENIDWINSQLKFKGRVEREQWVEQAQALVAERSAS